MMPDKLIEWNQVNSLFHDNESIMFGGFMGVGTPDGIVNSILASGVRDLTLIGNDSALPGIGVAPLIAKRLIKKLIVSHIGTNPETGKQMLAGDLIVELSPQGTLIERIRCGGVGLGGILTPTGIGTVVEDGKQRISAGGRDYLLELPIRAHIAIIKAKVADKFGNLTYEKSARNFNPIIAMAADLVLVEADEIVEVGEIDPDDVMTPGILVTHLVHTR